MKDIPKHFLFADIDAFIIMPNHIHAIIIIGENASLVGNADLRFAHKQLTLPATLLENIKTTLQNMGYQPRDIDRVLQILPENYETLEQILPFMIREL